MARWTDSDNLRGREALVVRGPLDGMRIVVSSRAGELRYPDVVDLSAYEFDPKSWTFELREEFSPPRIECCRSAAATGGAYHAPDCQEAS